MTIRWTVTLIALFFAAPAWADDWLAYGGDDGGSHYSARTQISRDNVADLELAWTYQTGELDERPERKQASSLHTTPILLPDEAGGALVFCTAFNKIVSLNPLTGAEQWVYDPEVIDFQPFAGRYNCRGIAYWEDTAAQQGQACKHRLFMGTSDLRVIAIDATNGTSCDDFADNGSFDAEPFFRDGVEDFVQGNAQFSSPPALVSDTVIMGSSNNRRSRNINSPKGTIHAFDARTGVLKWTFDPVPFSPDDPEHENWTQQALAVTSGANAWSMMAVDAERDLVFLPTGSASPDHFGGHRPGDNRYSDSVVALRGSTGELVWHFQTVHHDVWDWDLPAQPMLVDITRNGESIPAVVQLTKMGLVFVLHRETGEPLFDIEERPVPTDGVPGEVLSPTQPFPAKPPPLIEQNITPDDAWGLTVWDKSQCRDLIASFNYGPVYTPPTVKGTAAIPGISVTNWGGGAYDAASNTLITTASRIPFVFRLVPKADLEGQPAPDPRDITAARPINGADFALARYPLLGPFMTPCTAPPWSSLVAVDLGEGTIKWSRGFGTIEKLAPLPLTFNWGSPTSGGPIVTAGGVIFIGATADEMFRAFDIETGAELWSVRTPTASMATPMTYEAGGRQFVVVASGGHMFTYPQKIGDWLVAYALPEKTQ